MRTRVLLFMTLFFVLIVFFAALPDQVAATEMTSIAATGEGEIAAINGQPISIVSETGFYIFIGVIFIALAGLLIFGMRKERTPPVK